MTLHEAIQDGCVHERAGSRQLLGRYVVTILKQGSGPLVVDLRGPFGPKKRRRSQLDQEVSERSWVKDASVVDNSVSGVLNTPSPAPEPVRPELPLRQLAPALELADTLRDR